LALDFKLTALTWSNGKQGNDCSSGPKLNRRHLLKLGVASMVAPWLDKNGNHNQSPMPNVELSNCRTVEQSNIYHLKGKLTRCNGFHAMGTDNKGNRLAWGTPTTDYSYMVGEYWAARQGHQAVFTHTD
jgi:hypothetical protein